MKKKGTQDQIADMNVRFSANKKRAENKDDIDSRKNEEQDFRGNNITHNRKDQHQSPRSHK